MSALVINSSARYADSNSRVLTDYLAQRLGVPVVNRDLADTSFPPLSSEDLMDMHNGREFPRESLLTHQAIAKELIAEIKNADTIVFGVPVYNFTVPTVLNQWIDYVVKSGITFQYGNNGPEGLSGVKTAYIVTASGGTDIGGEMDFASPYLELICRFIGVENIHHIKASGSKGTPEEIIAYGKEQIDSIL